MSGQPAAYLRVEKMVRGAHGQTTFFGNSCAPEGENLQMSGEVLEVRYSIRMAVSN